MGPYSHFVLATRIKTLVKPENEGEYYWGSIIPDIRYLAQMRRAQTHLDEQRIRELIDRYPQLTSFLQGYRVHCLLDEIDLQEIVGKVFPLNILKSIFQKELSQQQITVLVELYFIQTVHTPQSIAGDHDEILAELGIKSTHTEKFSSAMQSYFDSPCFETALTTFRRLGMVDNSRIEKYISAASKLEKMPF